MFEEASQFLNGIEQSDPRVLVIPRGVIYLLGLQQQAGALRPDIQFFGDEEEARSADYVMFQCMESDYTELCWALVREAGPAYALMPRDTPLLLAYDREAVAAALARLRK